SSVVETVLAQLGSNIGVLRAQCSPHHVNSTLYPFIELIRISVGAAEGESPTDEQLSAFVRRYSLADRLDPVVLASLISGIGNDALEALSASQRKDLMLKLIARWLVAQIDQQPTVLLIEDLHWADPTTTELLADLLRLAARTRLLILMTSREELPSACKQTNVASIRLTRLPKRDCNELIDRM